ncbi:MAG: GDP-mannose 4,6-dehydratase [Bdellovibrionota bacterium]
MTYLITGGGGFIGRSLVRFLQAKEKKVFWTSLDTNPDPSHIQLDILDHQAVIKNIEKTKADVIIHLAAMSSVKDSFTDWKNTIRTNYEGSFSVFEAVRKANPSATIISTGSSAEYGEQAKSHDFLKEDLKPLPTNPYAISKSSQAALVDFYHRVHKIKAIHIRPFAVIGPEKRGDFVSDFLIQALQCKHKLKSKIELGDIQRQRDFIDIEDFCHALEILENKGIPGETYNVANGKANPLQMIIDLALEILKTPIEIKTSPAQLRLSDDHRLVADIKKLTVLGYSQKISLRESVERILQHIEIQNLHMRS